MTQSEHHSSPTRRSSHEAGMNQPAPIPCILRPVRLSDFEVFDQELFSPEKLGKYQWFGWRNPQLARAEFHETGFLTKDGGRLTVESADGQVAGRVQWRIARWGAPDTEHCW